jgi:hypothetical protein
MIETNEKVGWDRGPLWMRILAGALLVSSAWIGLALVGAATFPEIFLVYIYPDSLKSR